MGFLERVRETRDGMSQPGRRVARPDGAEKRLGLSQLAEMFSFQGVGYGVYLGGGERDREKDTTSFTHYVQAYYKDNGVIFAVILARILLFTEARFQWQKLRNGRPGDLFGTTELNLLENPWPSGTTGELLARMEQDVSLHGNFYAVRENNRIRRLRPDWVEIVLDAPPTEAVSSNIVGYKYRPGGEQGTNRAQIYLPNEVAHWSPIPDPLAQYRGMSWLTPVLRELDSDRAANEHKLKFFENAATPNLAVSFSESITKDQFNAFMKAMNASHQGSQNAYKTLYLGGGADVKVIGANMEQMDFKATQGGGETRICAAGGVPPIIVGLSEGLQSATYSNYGMARRKFGDHWARPQWRSACAALSTLVRVPSSARLWYDDRDIAFLREDQKDVAAIQTQQASTMKQLIDAGYKPDSITAAIVNEDWTLLEHTGLFSVQLQAPGAGVAPKAQPGPAELEKPKPSGASGDGGAPPAADKPKAGQPESTQPSSDKTDPVAPAQQQNSVAQLASEVGELRTLLQEVLADPRRALLARRLLGETARTWDEKDHPRGPDGKFGDLIDEEDQSHIPGVSASDLELLSAYSGDGESDDVNPWLRGMQPEYADPDDPDDVARIQATVDAMDRVFNTASLAEDTTVYRVAPLGEVKVGDRITDRAFMSWTSKKGVVNRYAGSGGDSVVIKADLPKGAKAIRYNDYNRHVGAPGEVILPRGTTVRVTDVTDGVASVVIE